jgi:hypothetical protein
VGEMGREDRQRDEDGDIDRDVLVQHDGERCDHDMGRRYGTS